jgi:biopolymer transport protein ExbB
VLRYIYSAGLFSIGYIHFTMDAIYELLNDGGPIVVPILLCSVIALTISIERYISLRKENIIPEKLKLTVLTLLDKGEINAAQELAFTDNSSLGNLLAILFKNKNNDRAFVVQRVEEAGRQEAAKMVRYLDALSVISSVAPMLGLMGTVLGMVVTFDAIQVHGLGNVDSLAGGISQALMTTLAGLLVGVPTLISYHYLSSIVDSRLLELEEISVKVLDVLLGSE